MILIVLSLSGCMQVSTFKEDDIDSLLYKLLKNDTSLVNKSADGYKYYLPNGVEVINSDNYNEKLYCNGNYYYLYVDIVSYYYDKSVDYEEDSSLFYSKKIEYNNKEGYLQITKEEEFYKIEFLYNYSKIEAYVSYDNLQQSIINMCYILNSMTFNDVVSYVEVGDVNEQFSEELYDFYTPKTEDKFIDYVKEYGEYEEDILDDSNNIGNEESE